jgi:alpha-D-ribose 1-methylphosphonate 5-triphosphate synthase subunit PhnH
MNTDLPGFADPVAGAQCTFRAVLDAMARPGTIHALPPGLTPPAPLAPATAALLLTLADGETRLHIAPNCAAATGWLVFHCGVTPCANPAEAAFVLATTLPDLAALATGSDEAPQDSATVILQVEALGTGPALTLSGPGLKSPAEFRCTGLPPGFAQRWAANRALFPRGIDLILCAGNRLAALPRSLTVREP